MLLALELFLIGKLLASGCDLVLRLDVRGIRPGRLSIRLSGASAAEAASHPADLQPGGKAFEVAFLLVGKVDCERFDLHARRSSCGHEGGINEIGGNRVGTGLALRPGFDSS